MRNSSRTSKFSHMGKIAFYARLTDGQRPQQVNFILKHITFIGMQSTKQT